MSIDILKKLVEQACSNGTISESDRRTLKIKATELQINESYLEQLINEELSKKSTTISSGFISESTNSNQSSGFNTDENVLTNQIQSSGFVIEPESPKQTIQSSGFISDNDSEINSQNNSNPNQSEISNNQNEKNKSAFSDVSILDNQGAMSLVQRGKLHGKWIIIKRIKPEYQNNPKYKELFYKEFENAYLLDHPNIVRLLDKGEDGEGSYYTMEFIDGRPLTKMIVPGGIKDRKLVKKIFAQMLDALLYVHKKQIFHRDLKPDNIHITYKGDNVKILDFGLAQADSFDDDLVKVGTPKYAAPEQKTKGNMVDQRADIYALGLIYLEMLTGDITDKSASTIESANAKIIIEKCLKENPAERFDGCDDIIEIHNKPEIEIDPQKEFVRSDFKAETPNWDQKTQENKVPPTLPKQEKKTTDNTKKSKMPLIIGILAVLAIIVIGFIFKDKLFSGKISEAEVPKYKQIGDSLFKNSDFNGAKTNYEKALTGAPNDEDIKKSLGNIAVVLRCMKNGEIHFNNKNIARAKICYDSVLALINDEPKASEKANKCNEIITNAKNIKLTKESGSGLTGFIDDKGFIVIDYQYADALDYKTGLAAIKNKEGKWGIIDINFKSTNKVIDGFIWDQVQYDAVNGIIAKNAEKRIGYFASGTSIQRSRL